MDILNDSTQNKLMDMFSLLLDRFGPQNWWPGDGPFEVMTGAILTQNTNWSNVEKALVNLKKKNLLSIEGLNKIPAEKLADIIRPAGYYNIKSKRNLFVPYDIKMAMTVRRLL